MDARASAPPLRLFSGARERRTDLRRLCGRDHGPADEARQPRDPRRGPRVVAGQAGALRRSVHGGRHRGVADRRRDRHGGGPRRDAALAGRRPRLERDRRDRDVPQRADLRPRRPGLQHPPGGLPRARGHVAVQHAPRALPLAFAARDHAADHRLLRRAAPLAPAGRVGVFGDRHAALPRRLRGGRQHRLRREPRPHGAAEPRPADGPRSALARARGARPAEERLLREREPRAAHAADVDPRDAPRAPRERRARREAARRDGRAQRRAPARDDRRAARAGALHERARRAQAARDGRRAAHSRRRRELPHVGERRADALRMR